MPHTNGLVGTPTAGNYATIASKETYDLQGSATVVCKKKTPLVGTLKTNKF